MGHGLTIPLQSEGDTGHGPGTGSSSGDGLNLCGCPLPGIPGVLAEGGPAWSSCSSSYPPCRQESTPHRPAAMAARVGVTSDHLRQEENTEDGNPEPYSPPGAAVPIPRDSADPEGGQVLREAALPARGARPRPPPHRQ